VRMLTLRPYQEAAVQAVYRSLQEQDGNPALCLATGAGKSLVIAKICSDVVRQWGGRVFVISHVKEIIQQNAEKIRILMDGLGVGIYSAGLRSRDTDTPVVVAGIQSVYRRACDLGRADLAIIDECHLLGDDADSMYQRFLADLLVINPQVRLIGLTATPFRLKQGLIYGPGRMFSHLAYDTVIKDLIRDGFLSPLISKVGKTSVDTKHLHVRAGEFIADEIEQLMDQDHLVDSACTEIIAQTQARHAILIFAAGVAHATHVAQVLREQHGAEVATIFGTTSDEERAGLIERFRTGKLRFLVNVNVLTTGFDAPNVDCVVMLRPTLSPGLWAQCVGRGFRLAPGKTDCLVLDFGGNALRHGPVDALVVKDHQPGGTGEAPAKECPQCQVVVPTSVTVCPQCGHSFPPPQRQQHEAQASSAGVLTGQFTDAEHAVRSVYYAVHQKRGADPATTPKTLRVEYEVGWNEWIKEWVCIEHSGYARTKAEAWWRARTNLPCPATAAEAEDFASRRLLAEPSTITVRTTAGEDFPRIIAYALVAKGTMREPGADEHEPAYVSTYTTIDDEPPF
jgi:DNA repair protein RadD